MKETITPFNHGGDITGFLKKIGKSEEDILDFSSNITPLPVSPVLTKVYQDAIACLGRYPDSYAREFCREIGIRFGVDHDCVIAGNGAISLIDLVLRAYRPQQALLIQPCFNEYQRLLHLYGAQVREIFLKEEEDFQFSYKEILDHLKGIDMLILGYPNNPTGTALDRQEMVALIQETKRRGVFLLVDEAFIDWNPQLSIDQEIQRNSSLVVVRSLTKFFGLAGIRSGFAFADQRIIEKMRSVQEPWSCNGLAQRLSVAALREVEFQQRTLFWFTEESKFLEKRLSFIPGIKIFPSLANFFLAKLMNPDQEEIFWTHMESCGIYLREMGDFCGLSNRYFRMALKTREENLILIDRLQEALVENKLDKTLLEVDCKR